MKIHHLRNKAEYDQAKEPGYIHFALVSVIDQNKFYPQTWSGSKEDLKFSINTSRADEQVGE